MKKICCFVLALLLLLCSRAVVRSADELTAIQQAIKTNGAQWVAGDTAISRLSAAEIQKRLGLRFPKLTGNERLLSEAVSAAVSLPSHLDWRNNGGNYVTAVRDQGNCGSCWAFATTAALESAILRASAMPGLDLNLSEQVMVSCSGAGDCEMGGYVDSASNFIQSTGLPLDAYYGYLATDGNCSDACSSWRASPPYRISNWSYVATTSPSVSGLKNALYSSGPLVTTFKVYQDFFSYVGGIYSYTWGGYLGGHAVLIVGYDDPGQYFIVKNSWAADWGEQGYFRIAYSQLSNAVNFGYYTIAFSGISAPKQSMSVSAASYSCQSLPADSINAVFGTDLAVTTQAADKIPLPTVLGGTSVVVRDSSGVERPAPLFYVSPYQVNYLMPEGTAAGSASVKVTNQSGVSTSGAAAVGVVGPGFFTANSNGQGVVAANALRVKADDSQSYEPVSQHDAAQKKFVPVPIDLGPATEKVYLILYGTGLRHRSTLSAVTVTIGGVSAEVSYAGAQGYYVGLDQVNVLIPRSLAGRGEIDVVLSVDGKTANTAKVNIK